MPRGDPHSGPESLVVFRFVPGIFRDILLQTSLRFRRRGGTSVVTQEPDERTTESRNQRNRDGTLLLKTPTQVETVQVRPSDSSFPRSAHGPCSTGRTDHETWFTGRGDGPSLFPNLERFLFDSRPWWSTLLSTS